MKLCLNIWIVSIILLTALISCSVEKEIVQNEQKVGCDVVQPYLLDVFIDPGNKLLAIVELKNISDSTLYIDDVSGSRSDETYKLLTLGHCQTPLKSGDRSFVEYTTRRLEGSDKVGFNSSMTLGYCLDAPPQNCLYKIQFDLVEIKEQDSGMVFPEEQNIEVISDGMPCSTRMQTDSSRLVSGLLKLKNNSENDVFFLYASPLDDMSKVENPIGGNYSISSGKYFVLKYTIQLPKETVDSSHTFRFRLHFQKDDEQGYIDLEKEIELN